MELKIFKETERTDRVIYLKFFQEEGTDHIHVVACDKSGAAMDGGFLITLSPNGVHLENFVNPAFGFPLEGKKQIKIV
jgi:hypothetical protein